MSMSGALKVKTIEAEIEIIACRVENEVAAVQARSEKNAAAEEASLAAFGAFKDLLRKEMELFQSLAEDYPTIASEPYAKSFARVEVVCASIEEAIVLCWKSRIEANRRYLTEMRATTKAEEEELVQVGIRAERLSCVMGLQPLSEPGDRISKMMSATKAKAKLLELEGQEAEDPCSPKNVGTTIERSIATHEHVLDLQMQFRLLEQRKLAGLPLIVRDPPEESIRFFDRRPPSKILATEKSRTEPIPRNLFLPNEFRESNASVGKMVRLIDVRNSQESFRGYVKETQKKIAGLQLAANIEFILVPGDTYTIGQTEPAVQTLFPISGSIDRCARLDGRTQYWLLSDSSRATEGIEYLGGPPHCMFGGVSSTIDLPGYYVQKRLMTIGQFKKLLREKRFRDVLPHVSSTFLRPKHTAVAFLSGNPSEIVLEEKYPATNEVDNFPLEVPFFVAESIACALGACVVPVDIYEAGTRGKECVEFSINPIEVVAQKLPWSVQVDGGTRQVHGFSTILPSIEKPYASPFGLLDTVVFGAEWNSCHNVGADATKGTWSRFPSTVEFNPSTHVLRSGTDLGSQTQHIQNVQLNQEERKIVHNSFVGPSFATVGLPNRGIQLAGFRLAFPCLVEDFKTLQNLQYDTSRKRGLNLTWDSLIFCFGASRDKFFSHLSDLQVNQETIDPLYGYRKSLLLAAGIDLIFSKETPHSFFSFTLYAPPKYISHPEVVCHTIAPTERGGFSGTITTDNAPDLPFSRSTFSEWRSLVKNIKSIDVLNDTAGEFAFEDSMSLASTLVANASFIFSLRLTFQIDSGDYVRSLHVENLGRRTSDATL